MKKGKLVRRIVIGVVVLVVVAVAGVWLRIDSLAKRAVERGGEFALGVPTTVDTLTLSLVGGSLRMDRLNIANPTGFGSNHLMRSGRFEMAVRPGSVLSDTIEIPMFELNGLDLNIEAKGLKTNIAAVLEHVRKLGGSGEAGQPAPQQQTRGGKKVRVNRVVIRDVVAHVVLPGGRPLTVKVPTIELNNVSSDKPIDVAELIGRLMPAIVAAVLEQGKEIIPAELLAGLQMDVAGTVAALGGQATQLVQQATTAASAQVQQVLQQVQQGAPAEAQKVIGEASHQAQGALQKAVGGVAAATSQPAGPKNGLGQTLEGLLKKNK